MYNMQAGKLKDIITIYNRNITRDQYNQQSVEYTKCYDCRAQVIYNKSTRTTINDEVVINFIPSFIIRYYHDIDETMLVEHKGIKYRITSILFDNNNQSKSIFCESLNE